MTAAIVSNDHLLQATRDRDRSISGTTLELFMKKLPILEIRLCYASNAVIDTFSALEEKHHMYGIQIREPSVCMLLIQSRHRIIYHILIILTCLRFFAFTIFITSISSDRFCSQWTKYSSKTIYTKISEHESYIRPILISFHFDCSALVQNPFPAAVSNLQKTLNQYCTRQNFGYVESKVL